MRRSARCSPPGPARCSIWVAASGWSARPPAFTDAHHVRHWVDGGATDLANLALVCRRQVGQVGGAAVDPVPDVVGVGERRWPVTARPCLLYTSDAADDLLCVDLGGRRIIKKKKKNI